MICHHTPAASPPISLVLASSSPRRRELLSQLGVTFDITAANIDETTLAGDDSAATARRLASEKARVALDSLGVPPHTVVLAADTLVELDGASLGKPADSLDATRMLRRLSRRRHIVNTAVAVATAVDKVAVRVVATTVEFRTLSPAEIAWYVGTAEPLDKAGSYGLGGAGGAFVTRIDGSYSNVIGLPLSETVEMLRAAGIEVMTP